MRERFAGASGNTWRAWERGKFAVSFIFSRNLVEVLGISGDFPFLVWKKNMGVGFIGDRFIRLLGIGVKFMGDKSIRFLGIDVEFI